MKFFTRAAAVVATAAGLAFGAVPAAGAATVPMYHVNPGSGGSAGTHYSGTHYSGGSSIGSNWTGGKVSGHNYGGHNYGGHNYGGHNYRGHHYGYFNYPGYNNGYRDYGYSGYYDDDYGYGGDECSGMYYYHGYWYDTCGDVLTSDPYED